MLDALAKTRAMNVTVTVHHLNPAIFCQVSLSEKILLASDPKKQGKHLTGSQIRICFYQACKPRFREVKKLVKDTQLLSRNLGNGSFASAFNMNCLRVEPDLSPSPEPLTFCCPSSQADCTSLLTLLSEAKELHAV